MYLLSKKRGAKLYLWCHDDAVEKEEKPVRMQTKGLNGMPPKHGGHSFSGFLYLS